MPQLDTVSFMSQYFWFIIIFLLIYFRVVLYYLPNIARSLKLRYKLRNQDQAEITRISRMTTELDSSVDKLMGKTLATVNSGISEIKKGSEAALNKALKDVNKESAVQNANTLYINSLINLHIKTYILGALASKLSSSK
jgi:F0F1-type ATP synthase membrane subunit b/b'